MNEIVAYECGFLDAMRLLKAGMNLYDSNGEDIGTILSVGSGTAVLTANVVTSYSGT